MSATAAPTRPSACGRCTRARPRRPGDRAGPVRPRSRSPRQSGRRASPRPSQSFTAGRSSQPGLDEARHPRERAARSRRPSRCAGRSAGARSSTSRPPATAARAGDKSRWVDGIEAHCSRARSISRCTPRRTCRASWPPGSRCSATPRARERRGRAVRLRARSSARAAVPASARQACGVRRSCAPHGRTSRSSRCAATSTRLAALADPTPARRDRARPRRTRSPRPRGRGRGELDNGASCRRPARASSRSRDAPTTADAAQRARQIGDARALVVPARRAGARRTRSTPTAARRSARAPGPDGDVLTLAAWVGAADGSAWLQRRAVRRRRAAAGARRRRSRNDCSPRARRELLAGVGSVSARAGSTSSAPGPGDRGLLTARALELIAHADVILYDRLIPHAALDGARADAELLFVGKEGARPSMPQGADRGADRRAGPRRARGRAPEGRRPVHLRPRRRGGARRCAPRESRSRSCPASPRASPQRPTRASP